MITFYLIFCKLFDKYTKITQKFPSIFILSFITQIS